MIDRLGVGPPERGPGLLLFIRLSSRTAIKDWLDIVNQFLVLALHHTADLL